MTEIVKCIDISHWQGFPDFKKVRAQGVIAMIHKATEGQSYQDPNRRQNIINATKAGIKCCTYHWLKPGDAAEQMAFYLRAVDPVEGERMVIDYEETGCTLDDLKAAVEMLIGDPRNLQVTVYSGHLLKEQLGDKHDSYLADHTDLWLAQYTTGTPTWPKGTYPQWALWQYSESGKLDGIEGSAVDLDRFNGTDAMLLEWISPDSDQPIPGPDPETIPISVALTLPDDVAITISINGEVIYGEQS
jgi:lysozyme